MGRDIQARLGPQALLAVRWPGLVWAYRMAPGARPAELAADEIETALAASDGWLWLHLDLLDNRAFAWLGRDCALPDAVRRLFESHDDDLVLDGEGECLHGIAADFQSELGQVSTNIGRLHFWAGPRLLLTGRRHPLAAIDTAHQALRLGQVPAGPFDLLARIVAAFCRSANSHLKAMMARLDKVEDRVFETASRNDRRELMGVRRLAVSIHRPISAMVALFDPNDMAHLDMPSDAREALDLLAGRLVAIDRNTQMVRDRARLLYEEVVAQLADESNRSLKAMAIMSALLLPGSLTAGVFGMNVAGLPLVASPAGFWITLAIGAVATAGFYWILHRFGVSLRL